MYTCFFLVIGLRFGGLLKNQYRTLFHFRYFVLYFLIRHRLGTAFINLFRNGNGNSRRCQRNQEKEKQTAENVRSNEERRRNSRRYKGMEFLSDKHNSALRHSDVKSRQPGCLFQGDPQLSDTASRRLWLYSTFRLRPESRDIRSFNEL